MNILEELPILNTLSPEIQDTVLRIIMLVVALVVVLLLRRVLTWALIRPLRKLASRTDSKTDDQVVEAIVQPMRLVAIAFGIAITVSVFDFGPEIRDFADKIVRSLIIGGVLMGIYKIIDIIAFTPRDLLRFTGIEVQARLLPFLRTATKLLLLVLGGLIIIQEWGYDVSGLIASLGVVGLAFSLAAKDTIENLFGFTVIVSDNPFKVGDFIEHPDVKGTIEHVGMRSTRVRQPDQGLVTVPNGKMAQASVLNWSRLYKRWYDYIIGVTYDATGDDIRALLGRIRALLEEREHVEKNSILVRFVNFGDSALEIEVRCYLWLPAFDDFAAEREQIHLAIMDIVEELGMSMAFPSTSVYVESIPASAQMRLPADAD